MKHRAHHHGAHTPRTDEHYYAMIDARIERTFTSEQREAVRNAIKRAVWAPSHRVIDFRTTFWFLRRLYVMVFIGLDPDSTPDLGAKGYVDQPTFIRSAFRVATMLLLVFMILILLFSVIYTIKCAFGIDIFPDQHLRDFLP